MTCKITVVTNWTFDFFTELKVEGAEQIFHIPVLDLKTVPFDVVVIFRPKASMKAVILIVRNIPLSEIYEKMPIVPKEIASANEF